MDACGSCATKGDARRRQMTTGNVTTSRRTRGKREERRQQTRGNGASIGQGCTFRGGGRVKTRGGGINGDYRGGSKSNRNGDGNVECHAPPSWDLAAEAAAVLIADDADGGNIGVAIAGSASRDGGWGF
jgi:hypothetical protein